MHVKISMYVIYVFYSVKVKICTSKNEQRECVLPPHLYILWHLNMRVNCCNSICHARVHENWTFALTIHMVMTAAPIEMREKNASSVNDTHVNINAWVWECLVGWIGARRVSVELAQTTIKFNRIQWGAAQIACTFQCSLLSSSHYRWLNG